MPGLKVTQAYSAADTSPSLFKDVVTITNTTGPSPTPSRTPTRVGGAGGTAVAAVTTSAAGSATPTRIQAGGITATATRTFTPTGPGGGGEGLTRTPTPTALPDTGFASAGGVDNDARVTLHVVGHGPNRTAVTIEVEVYTTTCPVVTPLLVMGWRQL